MIENYSEYNGSNGDKREIINLSMVEDQFFEDHLEIIRYFLGMI